MKRIVLIVLSVILSFSGMDIIALADTQIAAFSNGNESSDTFDKGVFTAESSGSGIFAIALYKNDELIQISVADSDDELESIKLNMIVDDIMGTTMKIFRLDSNANPLCINETLVPVVKDYRVYFNENFNGNSKMYKANGVNTIITDEGRLSVVGKNTRACSLNVNYPDRYVTIEADYTIPENVDFANGYLISGYTNSPVGMVYIRPDGIYAGWPGNKDQEKVYDSSLRNFNLACKLDMETFTFDVYINRKKVNSKPLSLNGIIPSKYGSFLVYAAYLVEDDKGGYLNSLVIDNYKAYSGTDFIDIGNDIITAHKTDFKTNPLWQSNIYERPESYEIAKKALETGHPRVLLNKEDVKRIKESNDKRIIEWREKTLQRADSYLSKEPYEYLLSSTDSIENIPESISLMMDLGMAYLLTGDSKYSDRAYSEAQVLFTVPYKKVGGTSIPVDKRDYWNSKSYLDIAEISFITGLCYDWMYDAWNDTQKKELTDNIMDKGLLRSYNALVGNLNPTNLGINDWYKATNNWNAVCNGGIFISAIAFMEANPYLCGTVAEATLRGIEHLLPNYAPAGSWSEGAGYWSYTLQYLTAMCSTLDSACGTDYGISKTVGLKESQLYSISLEGKTGIVNYGDAASNHINAPFMFYWASKYKESNVGGAALYIKEKFGLKPNCFDLVYYNPDYVVENWNPPLSFYYEGTEVVSFSSGNDINDTYISMSGGKGVATSHDHLDSGSVVLDMKGKRLFSDIGAEHYGADEYFSGKRYLYFRVRPESHNTFIIDPENLLNTDGKAYYGQNTNAVSTLTSYDKQNQNATMNLTDAYGRDVTSAERNIRLDGKFAVITDKITVKDTKDIYWNWYIKTSNEGKTFGKIDVLNSGTSAVITLDGTEYTIEFESNQAYMVYVEDADYYKDVDPDVDGIKHSNSDYQRLVLKIENASDDVIVKTIVK